MEGGAVMNFILDERSYVKWLIENGTMGKSEKISIRLLLKYYRSLGFTEQEAKDELVEFMSLNMPFFKAHEWTTLIDRLATLVYEQEQELVSVTEVVISKREMEAILSMEDFDCQKILYMLLVYKKIQNQLHRHVNEWFNGSLGEVFKMARMSGKKSTTQAQGEMIYLLKEAGLIQLAKSLKSLNLKLSYMDLEPPATEEDIALTITQFDDVIYDFYHYTGHRVVRCQMCGKMIRLKKGERKSRKYCVSCKRIAVNDKSSRCYHRVIEGKTSIIAPLLPLTFENED